jgi:hypothetical protein
MNVLKADYFPAFCAANETIDAEIFPANLTFGGVFGTCNGAAFRTRGGAVGAEYFPADSAVKEFACGAKDYSTTAAGYAAVPASDMSVCADCKFAFRDCDVAVVTGSLRDGAFCNGVRFPRQNGGVIEFIQRDFIAIVFHPLRSLAVQGTFEVVRLVREHFGDTDDEVGERFARCPVIADADGMGSDIGVKRGGFHFTLGSHPRITSGEMNFHDKIVAALQFPGYQIFLKPCNKVFELIAFRRTAYCLEKAYAGVVSKI